MSELNSGDSKDYSKYDEMSTESLEELLRLDAELPDGEGSDIDEILYISEVIVKRDKEHPTGRYSEVDVDAAWETFQTKYLPYVTDGRSLYDFDDDDPSAAKDTAPDSSTQSKEKRISTRKRRRLGRVASIAAAIALLLGLTTLTAYALGYDLWGVIAQWTKDTFMFVPESSATNAESSNAPVGEYADLQAALDAYGVTEHLAPTWIPEGFVGELVSVDDTSDPTLVAFHASYKCGDRWLVIQINMYQDSSNILYTYWEKDDIEVTTLEIENHKIYVMENAGRQCAIWSSGPFECSVISDLLPGELSKVIKSMI